MRFLGSQNYSSPALVMPFVLPSFFAIIYIARQLVRIGWEAEEGSLYVMVEVLWDEPALKCSHVCVQHFLHFTCVCTIWFLKRISLHSSFQCNKYGCVDACAPVYVHVIVFIEIAVIYMRTAHTHFQQAKTRTLIIINENQILSWLYLLSRSCFFVLIALLLLQQNAKQKAKSRF